MEMPTKDTEDTYADSRFPQKPMHTSCKNFQKGLNRNTKHKPQRQKSVFSR